MSLWQDMDDIDDILDAQRAKKERQLREAGQTCLKADLSRIMADEKDAEQPRRRRGILSRIFGRGDDR